MQTVCCICHKTKTANRWVKSAHRCAKKISHGYCPRCFRQMMEKMRSYFNRRHCQTEA